jgi:hypothetical protein
MSWRIYQGIAEPPRVAPEVLTLDKWFRPFSEPVRIPARLGTGSQQFLVLVKAAPFGETNTEDRWHQPWSEPRRDHVVKRHLIAEAASGGVISPSALTQPEAVTEDRWHQPWSEPVRFRRLPTSEQQTLAYVRVADEVITPDKWFAPLAEPVRFRRFPTSEQRDLAYVRLLIETITQDKWYRALSEPVRFRELARALHPFFAYYPPPIPSPFVPVETNNRAYVTIYEQEYVPSAQVTIYEGKP